MSAVTVFKQIRAFLHRLDAQGLKSLAILSMIGSATIVVFISLFLGAQMDQGLKYLITLLLVPVFLFSFVLLNMADDKEGGVSW